MKLTQIEVYKKSQHSLTLLQPSYIKDNEILSDHMLKNNKLFRQKWQSRCFDILSLNPEFLSLMTCTSSPDTLSRLICRIFLCS